MLKKLLLWFQIRTLEATVYARAETFPLVQDVMTLANMELAQSVTMNEINRLKRKLWSHDSSRASRGLGRGSIR